ncbi:MAG: S-layer homology domain-containing protein [bacterium]|nr:S-layer homology domain-containing protein [bacterium]
MLKKIFALASFILSFNAVCVNAFEDIHSEDAYYNQITSLSEAGIINGYEDNTFRPQNYINRGEFAKIFCTALNITKCTGKSFSDVPADSWASKYIDALCSSEIIDGFEDGTFRPNDNIRLKDAIKMIVCAQGFAEKAEKKGGYPHGYIMIAHANGYMYNISLNNESELTRSQAAVLLYNAMNAQLYQLEKRVYGDYYNGYLHIGVYPQSWQGIANDSEIFDIKPNVFRKSLPKEIKVTSDGINYHTTIKSDSGLAYEWFDLPKNKPYIDNYSYDFVTGSFVSLGDEMDITAFSYDLETWYDGKPKDNNEGYEVSEPVLNNLPLNPDSDKIISYLSDDSPVIVMEISDTLHADPTYYTQDYITQIGRHICVSRNKTTWTNIILPDNAMYATAVYVNADNNSFVVSCEVPLDEKEQQYVDEVEQEAISQGMIYDKPTSKTENYMIPFDDIT